jgi:hypothetical protein
MATAFPIGYHSLHADASMNFQMNRWFGWVGEPEMLTEMRISAPRIATYADWTAEFLALAERASQQGHVLRAGFYWRSAEFFMPADDPERTALPLGTFRRCPSLAPKARLFSLADSIAISRS